MSNQLDDLLPLIIEHSFRATPQFLFSRYFLRVGWATIPALFLCTGCTVCRGCMDAKERRAMGHCDTYIDASTHTHTPRFRSKILSFSLGRIRHIQMMSACPKLPQGKCAFCTSSSSALYSVSCVFHIRALLACSASSTWHKTHYFQVYRHRVDACLQLIDTSMSACPQITPL